MAMLKTMNHEEYPKRLMKMSEGQLRFLIQDAKHIMRAKPDNPNNAYYEAEIAYAYSELNRRGINMR